MRLITCSLILATLPVVIPPSAFGQPRGISPPSGLSISKTRLEARTYSGGDLDSSFPWLRHLVVASGSPVHFRWQTSESAVSAARWEVTDAPGGFSGVAVMVASGELSAIPASGQSLEFKIDFGSFLPASPPGSPKDYHVRITPRQGTKPLASSRAVKVTHQKPGPQPVFVEFDINRFEQNIRDRVAGKVVGYSYAIYLFDTLKRAGAGGHASLPNTMHSADRRATLFSTSKTITATAVMKAMELMRARGIAITIDSTIARYLPNNWTRGPHVNEMTFRKLLTHKSGLRGAGPDPDTYDNLRQTIASGATDANFADTSVVYENANFCLFRVIIPYMVSDRAALYAATQLPGIAERITAQKYVDFVKENVLNPIGLNDVQVVPTGPSPHTRYYNFMNTSTFAADPIDDTALLRAGAGYWNMSAKEFGRFISSLRYQGRIISSESMKVMMDNNLGMYAGASGFGKTWDHNGSATNAAGAGGVSAWMAFSNGVTAVIFANSQGGLAEAPQVVLREAFNAAW